MLFACSLVALVLRILGICFFQPIFVHSWMFLCSDRGAVSKKTFRLALCLWEDFYLAWLLFDWYKQHVMADLAKWLDRYVFISSLAAGRPSPLISSTAIAVQRLLYRVIPTRKDLLICSSWRVISIFHFFLKNCLFHLLFILILIAILNVHLFSLFRRCIEFGVWFSI